MPTAETTNKQIQFFQNEKIWKGGYFEGDPLDPMAASSYAILGYMSILHATYLACIKPYVNADTRALEIGPGRGAWTRTLLPAKEVVCLDALPAQHNRFWEYVGNAPNVKYIQVSDFECKDLPDDHFDYLFSFGVFCHISPEGSREYFKSMYRKMKSGAHCFVMIADLDKFKSAVAEQERISAFRAISKRRFWPARALWQFIYSLKPALDLKPLKAFGDEERFDRVGFHYLGVQRACEMLTAAGFEIVDPDVGTVYRDPIIHFKKP